MEWFVNGCCVIADILATIVVIDGKAASKCHCSNRLLLLICCCLFYCFSFPLVTVASAVSIAVAAIDVAAATLIPCCCCCPCCCLVPPSRITSVPPCSVSIGDDSNHEGLGAVWGEKIANA